MKGIQILGIFYGIFMFYRTIFNYKNNKGKLIPSVSWGAIWLVMIGLFLNPSLIYEFAPLFSTQNMFVSVSVVSFLFLFFILYLLYQKILYLEKKIELIVQNNAIESYYFKKATDTNA